MTKLRDIRDGGNIRRFHTRKMVRDQDVAQHSFNAALIAERISHQTENSDDHRVVMHMLLHDIPELWIGDTPGHIKAGNPELKEALNKAEKDSAYKNFSYRHLMAMYHLNDHEGAICRFSDLCECAFRAIEDIEMGNKSSKEVVDSCTTGMTSVLEEVSDIRDPCIAFEMASLLKEVVDNLNELKV